MHFLAPRTRSMCYAVRQITAVVVVARPVAALNYLSVGTYV